MVNLRIITIQKERERKKGQYNLSIGQTAFIDRKQPEVVERAIVLPSSVCLCEYFEQHNLLSCIQPKLSKNT